MGIFPLTETCVIVLQCSKRMVLHVLAIPEDAATRKGGPRAKSAAGLSDCATRRPEDWTADRQAPDLPVTHPPAWRHLCKPKTVHPDCAVLYPMQGSLRDPPRGVRTNSHTQRQVLYCIAAPFVSSAETEGARIPLTFWTGEPRLLPRS